MPVITITDTDNNALVDLANPIDAGETGGTLSIRVHNEQDNPDGDPAVEVALIVQTEDPETPGTYLSAGLQPQDELWSRLRVIGGGETGGDATYAPDLTGWQLAGAYRRMLLGTIPPGCYVELEYTERSPSTAGALSWRRRLLALVEEYSAPLPSGVAPPLHGILTGVGDAAHTGIVSGLAVTPSDTPDEYIHVGRGLFNGAGLLAGHVISDHELDQDDSAADTLTAGQAYRALVTAGPGGVPTVTKGLASTDPVDPTPPAGERRLARVTVLYQVGGTSEIGPDDVEDLRVLDRFALEEPASGRTAYVHAGEAVGGGTYRYHTGKSPVTVDPSTTAWVWQLATGLFTVHDSATEPPEASALGPWWEITTDTDDITEVRDLRTYADRTVVLSISGSLPGSPGTIDSLLVADEALMIESVLVRWSGNGGGSSGLTKLDLERTPLGGAAATIYTNHATDDARPVLAYNATDLLDLGDGQHEACELRRGDMLTLKSVTHPTGGTPATVDVHVICRSL